MEARSRARLCVKQLSWQRRYGWNLIQRILTGLYCVLLGDLRLRFWVEEGNRPDHMALERPGCPVRTSAVTDVGLHCFTVFRQRFHCWWWEFSDCDKRAARSDTLQCWLSCEKKIWWHWFAMAVIYKWPSKKSAILTRSRWDLLWDLRSGCGFVFTAVKPLSVTLGGIRVWQLPSPQDLNKCLLQGFTDRTLFRSSQ